MQPRRQSAVEMVTNTFDANGKIAKPPSYSKPNLEQFV